ncbi:MAG: GTP-binding protein [Chloroflexi bacterium]|nr:MAG: GTP-binding protein [Chloroflexota bacterium]
MANAVIALAGNPNAGKSTIFNALTGSRQHVGNWPGKTVEKKEGLCQINGQTIQIVDLPGTYSLSAFSAEEQIARDFIVREKPALVVNVVDAANLERNLYLTTQILETGIPTVLVLNMMDVAGRRGLQINAEVISQGLGGIPVITTTARRNEGLEQLRQAMARAVSPNAGTAPTTIPAGHCPRCHAAKTPNGHHAHNGHGYNGRHSHS